MNKNENTIKNKIDFWFILSISFKTGWVYAFSKKEYYFFDFKMFLVNVNLKAIKKNKAVIIKRIKIIVWYPNPYNLWKNKQKNTIVTIKVIIIPIYASHDIFVNGVSKKFYSSDKLYVYFYS